MMRFFTVANILAGLTAVHALPTSFDLRDISSSLLSQLSLYEQYSAAAYCPNNNSPGSSTAITCNGNCATVQSAMANSVLEFQNQGTVDATGFVAVDKTNKQIVIAYRGSHSVTNFLADSQFGQLPFLCSGCWVHIGFLSSWLATKSAVTNAVAAALKANPGYKIVATGHSLGASIATLAAADLRNSGYGVTLYTYGSPMTGNDAFATFVTNQPGGNYRVTHQADLVPKLPGYEILNYRHVSPQYWITSGDGVPVGTSNVQTSSGTKDTGGNYGTSGFSVSNHLWYFNSVSGCAPDSLELV